MERAVSKLDGVQEANVNLATKKLGVSFDESKVSVENIYEAVEKAGYKAVDDTALKTLKIEGMTCAACAKAVERAVSKLDGIGDVNVNLATEKLTVSFEPAQVRLSTIKQAVEKAGYKAVEEETQVDTDKEKKDREIKILWERFIISAIFTVPLLYIAMGHMIGLPLPRLFDPMVNSSVFALTQLFLTIPVVVMGYKFYTVGFKTLFKGSPNMDSLIAIGTSAAVLYGIFATIQILKGNTGYVMDLYFESAATIITLITLGKYLEAVSKGKTSEAIKRLMGLAPKTATVIKDGKEIEINIDEVEVGDVILLEQKINSPMNLLVEGRPMFEVQAGIFQGRRAVQLLAVKEERHNE